ncbi:hypothetical protein F2Q68_00001727 [Brassica cretica]|uniref:ABC1 atypical kinase-like domain-containing protein n=1 Tax=Brassica cretica TaxID=69181 RepID=A0A8S9JHQ2_BRACR|nr:hypothetical protein F2Q68_00001727 [Brassica cretica]
MKSEDTGICKARMVRAELAVDDRKDSATFVVFNKELTKLIKQDAATLALEEMSGGGGQDLPRCLEDLAGKDYVFQIRVTPCRFIPNQCTFTVSAISDDIFFGGEGGQPTTAASYTVDAAKRAMGVDEAHPPDFEDKEKAANAPVFAEFDPVPIASASLAQVHVARTHGGEKVAVKVQHAHMTDTAAADTAAVGVIVNTLHRIFPSFDYRWLLDEMSESLPKELDFLVEAKNSEKCLDNFRKMSPHIAEYVYAPAVYWNLSSSKLLTMEFMDGAQVNDVAKIKKLGIQPYEVSQTFAEMMFKHGFVHCDPHAANLIVRPSGKRNIYGKQKPQLVLLDHGLYKELDFNTRFNYASLWKALVFSDANAIKKHSAKLGAGDDLYVLFAGILTMRPWKQVINTSADHLVIKGTTEDRSELQMYASQYFPQISELLRRLPRVILLMLKTNDCLRSVNNELVKGSSLESFLIVGKVSSEAVLETKWSQKKSLVQWLKVWLEGFSVEARLWVMQFALWVLQVRKALTL